MRKSFNVTEGISNSLVECHGKLSDELALDNPDMLEDLRLFYCVLFILAVHVI